MIAPTRMKNRLKLIIRYGEVLASSLPAKNDPTIHISELGVTAKPAIDARSPKIPWVQSGR